MQQVIGVRHVVPIIHTSASIDHAVVIAVGVVSTPDDLRLLEQARDALPSRHGNTAATWMFDPAATAHPAMRMPNRLQREQIARLVRQRLVFCPPRHPVFGDVGLQAIASGVPLAAMNLEPWSMPREIVAGSAFLSVDADYLPQLSRRYPGSLQ